LITRCGCHCASFLTRGRFFFGAGPAGHLCCCPRISMNALQSSQDCALPGNVRVESGKGYACTHFFGAWAHALPVRCFSALGWPGFCDGSSVSIGAISRNDILCDPTASPHFRAVSRKRRIAASVSTRSNLSASMPLIYRCPSLRCALYLQLCNTCKGGTMIDALHHWHNLAH